MSVRAKMRCLCLTTTAYGETEASHQKTVQFSTVYDQSIPEDQRFQKATPNGKCEMSIDNPAALEQLIPGKSYYFDITPAD